MASETNICRTFIYLPTWKIALGQSLVDELLRGLSGSESLRDGAHRDFAVDGRRHV